VKQSAVGEVTLQTVAFSDGSVVDLGRTGSFLNGADWQALQ
jgi:hypothetical protein